MTIFKKKKKEGPHMDLWQIHLCLYEIKRDDEPVAQLEGVHKHKVGVLNHATHHFFFFLI